jgi:hypothetical protein
MTTSLNDRISRRETITKKLAKKYGFPTEIFGRQHLTRDQLDFIAGQSEQDFKISIKMLNALLRKTNTGFDE